MPAIIEKIFPAIVFRGFGCVGVGSVSRSP